MILATLVNHDDLSRKISPHFKVDFFEAGPFKIVGASVLEYIATYHKVPNQTECQIEVSKKLFGASKDDADSSNEMVKRIYTDLRKEALDLDPDWFIKNCQKFCQDRGIFNAVSQSMDILEGKKVGGKILEKGAILPILEEGISFSFDHRLGHNYFVDAKSRFDFYHSKHEAIPSSLTELNKVLGGEGYVKKTVTVFTAPPNTGKSAILTSEATDMMMRGKKVLYISLEMAEERVAQRIDANIIDVPVNDLKLIPEEKFMQKIQTAKDSTEGDMYFVEYPTGSAGVSHFRALMNDLKIKKQFVPDIVFIDYLNICASARVGKKDNLYIYGLAVSEELCGFAKEFNLPVVTACQVNRTGSGDSDFGMEDVADSWGIAMTVDCMIGMMVTEQLEQMGQIKFKQLRNRLFRVDFPKWFVANFDKNKMRFSDAKNQGAVDTQVRKPLQPTTYTEPSNIDGDAGFPFNSSNAFGKKPALATGNWKFE